MASVTLPQVTETRYAGGESVWDALGSGDVKALRLSWFLEQRPLSRLPRCQDLPSAAFIPVAELQILFGDEIGRAHV